MSIVNLFRHGKLENLGIINDNFFHFSILPNLAGRQAFFHI